MMDAHSVLSVAAALHHAGVRVACLTAAVQAFHHLGYDPDEKDHHDMRLLADRFGIALPAPYRR